MPTQKSSESSPKNARTPVGTVSATKPCVVKISLGWTTAT
jgi:hypothetical protein